METTPFKKRQAWPMLLLHIVAWGITLVVGAAFITANVRGVEWYWGPPTDTVFTAPLDPIPYNFYGWPIFCRKFQEPHKSIETSSYFHPIPLILDVVLGLNIIVATFFVFVFPLWRRKPFQFQTKSLFILTATIAVLCAVYQKAEPRVPYLMWLLPESGISRFFYVFPLYLQIPLGLGIGCAIYMDIWIVLRLVSALVRRIGNKAAKEEATL